MKFEKDGIYFSFELKLKKSLIHLIKLKCTDPENLYFENFSGEDIDFQFDDLNAVKRFVFKTSKECIRGVYKYIFSEHFRVEYH